jgi:hypothetical protein
MPDSTTRGSAAPLDAAEVLTRIADMLDNPEERQRIADLCADKKAVVALIALLLRMGAFSV